VKEMKKKLYDFSTANAVIVVLAYFVLIFFSIFTITHNDVTTWVEYTILGFLICSFIAIIVNYVLLAVTVTDEYVKHKKVLIPRSDLLVYIRHNYRFRCDELVFHHLSIQYRKLDKKAIKKNEISIQLYIKQKFFLEDYLNTKINSEETKLK
jgi:uncharacterized membrane protein (DUF485 family)